MRNNKNKHSGGYHVVLATLLFYHWGIMEWTSSLPEKTETWWADAFEMPCNQINQLVIGAVTHNI